MEAAFMSAAAVAVTRAIIPVLRKEVLERLREKWKTAETISNSSEPVVELVGMDELKDELIELLVQRVDKRRDASRRRIGIPHHGTTQMKQKIVIKVQMANDKSRSKAMAVVAATDGVDSVALAGEGKDQVVVVGDGVDSTKLTSALRKKVGPAQLVQVGEAKNVEEKRPAIVAVVNYPSQPVAVNAVNEHPATAYGYQQFVSPNPNMVEILIAILKEVTNEPYGGATEAAAEQSLIHSISNFLADKRTGMGANNGRGGRRRLPSPSRPPCRFATLSHLLSTRSCSGPLPLIGGCFLASASPGFRLNSPHHSPREWPTGSLFLGRCCFPIIRSLSILSLRILECHVQ